MKRVVFLCGPAGISRRELFLPPQAGSPDAVLAFKAGSGMRRKATADKKNFFPSTGKIQFNSSLLHWTGHLSAIVFIFLPLNRILETSKGKGLQKLYFKYPSGLCCLFLGANT